MVTLPDTAATRSLPEVSDSRIHTGDLMRLAFQLAAAFFLALTATSATVVLDGAKADEKAVAAIVAELDAVSAKGKGNEQEYAGVLRRAVSVTDPKIAKAVAKALRDDRPCVACVAADVLGRMQSEPQALAELHAFYNASKSRLAKEDNLLAEVVRDIGRHADPKSVSLLAEGVSGSGPFPAASTVARILALGNVRDKTAIEALLDITAPLGTGDKKQFHDELHLALCHATGQDWGAKMTAWREWWAKAKAQYRPFTGEATLPKKLEERWRKFWSREAGCV